MWNNGCRQSNQTGRSETIVEILIPLITQGSVRQSCGSTGRKSSNAGIPPEAHLAVGFRHGNARSRTIVYCEDSTHQRIFRAPAVSRWRAASWITPGSCPTRHWVGIVRIIVRFFIAHQSTVTIRTQATAGVDDVVFPAGFPVNLIAAEKSQVDWIYTCIPRRFNIGTLLARPILIVRIRQEKLVVANQIANLSLSTPVK